MVAASLELESLIDEGIRRSSERGYHPTTFIAMRQRHGTLVAISRLVPSGDIQSGFRRLVDLNLIEFTIEAAVKRFPSEFSREIVAAADWRLAQANGVASAYGDPRARSVRPTSSA